MSKMKDRLHDLELAIEIFGEYSDHFIIASDVPELEAGAEVTLVNKNCEFEYDNVNACFQQGLYYYYIVDLEFVSMDLSEYEVDKSNNGGAYAYGKFKVLKVHEKSY